MHKLFLTLCLALMLIQGAPTAAVYGQIPEAGLEELHYLENAADTGEFVGPASNQILANEQYLWIPGTIFTPQTSEQNYTMHGRSSLVSLSYGTGDNYAFTAPIWVPNGSRLTAMRFYYYDTSASNTLLQLVKYDGMGNQNLILGLTSSGSAGESSAFAEIGDGILGEVVDNSSGAYALKWHPHSDNDQIRLRAVRITYQAPATLPSTDYRFYAGSTLSPIYSSSTQVYGYHGCVYSPVLSDRFSADLDLPDGSIIDAVDHYFYDKDDSAKPVWANIAVRGAPDYQTNHPIFYVVNTNTNQGFIKITATSSTQIQIDQATLTYIVNGINTSPNRQYCGTRIKFTRGTVSTNALTQQNAPFEYQMEQTDILASSSLETSSTAALNTTLNTSSPQLYFVAQASFPTGASLKKARLFYFTDNPPVQLWTGLELYGQHIGGAIPLASVQPIYRALAFQNNESALDEAYTVDNMYGNAVIYAVL